MIIIIIIIIIMMMMLHLLPCVYGIKLKNDCIWGLSHITFFNNKTKQI